MTGVMQVMLCVGGPLDGQSFTASEWEERRGSADRNGDATLTQRNARGYSAVRGQGRLPSPLDGSGFDVTTLEWRAGRAS